MVICVSLLHCICLLLPGKCSSYHFPEQKTSILPIVKSMVSNLSFLPKDVGGGWGCWADGALDSLHLLQPEKCCLYLFYILRIRFCFKKGFWITNRNRKPRGKTDYFGTQAPHNLVWILCSIFSLLFSIKFCSKLTNWIIVFWAILLISHLYAFA